MRPTLVALPASGVQVLDGKAGATPRTRGTAWMNTRAEAMRRAGFMCVRCREQGIVRLAKVVDHRVPLEQGGTDDQSNLDPLCKAHHDLKTRREASFRAVGRFMRG